MSIAFNRKQSTVFLILLFVTGVFLTIYIVGSALPSSGKVYEYNRLRPSYKGKGDIEWTQNIGGSKHESIIKIFDNSLLIQNNSSTTKNINPTATENDFIFVFGNTLSSDFDFDNIGGFLAILDDNGSTKNIISLGQYGIYNIVDVIITHNGYVVLHDEGLAGYNISISILPFDLNTFFNNTTNPNFNVPTYTLLDGISTTRYANAILYNDDPISPELYITYTTKQSDNKSRLVAICFNMSTYNYVANTIIDYDFSLEFIVAYEFGNRDLQIFANAYNQMSNYFVVCINLTIGSSPKFIDFKTGDNYLAFSIMPTPLKNVNRYTVAASSDNQLVIIFIDLEFNEEKDSFEVVATIPIKTNKLSPISANFIYKNNGFYLFVEFELTCIGYYYNNGDDMSLIYKNTIQNLKNILNVTDWVYFGTNRNKLLLTGCANNGFFVAVIQNDAFIYNNSFGSGQSYKELNPKILFSMNTTINTTTIACDTTAGRLGATVGDIPNNYGDSDVLIARLKGDLY